MLIAALFTALVAQTPTWPTIEGELAPIGGGANDAAVVVGISAYYDLPVIAGAADNASAWQQWLLRTRQIPSGRVATLRDREATRERILGSVRTAVGQVKPGGVLWFVFIGHGAPAPSGTDGLLLGADTQADAESLSARGVAQEEVLALLVSGKQSDTVVLFDACFSGKSNDGQKPLVAGLQATLPVRKVSATRATVLASSDTFAGPLPGMNRPAFSYLLLGALRGWGDQNDDKRIALDEAFAFTRETMQAVLKTDARLPSMRGATSINFAARDVRPDVAALVAGRCPSGSSWEGARCKETPQMECPSGASWNGTACVSRCPPGASWNGRACAVTAVNCESGSHWNGTACEGDRVAAVVPEAARKNVTTTTTAAPVVPAPVEGGHRAGEVQSESKTNLAWVWMPAGRFTYGCEPQEGWCAAEEKGASRDVGAFWMLQTEVTVAAYVACVNAGACPTRVLEVDKSSYAKHECNGKNGRVTHPINCVDWAPAESFCAWIGGRLPTDWEWEYAAKSGASRVYPWGDDDANGKRVNYCEKRCKSAVNKTDARNWGDDYFARDDDHWGTTAPVGSYPAGDTMWGLKDMAGNVAEWTDGNDSTVSGYTRGGTWVNAQKFLRNAARTSWLKATEYAEAKQGIRCARSP